MRHGTYTGDEPAGPRNPSRRLDAFATCSALLSRARLLGVLWTAEHTTSEFGTAPTLLEPKFAPALTATGSSRASRICNSAQTTCALHVEHLIRATSRDGGASSRSRVRILTPVHHIRMPSSPKVHNTGL